MKLKVNYTFWTTESAYKEYVNADGKRYAAHDLSLLLANSYSNENLLKKDYAEYNEENIPKFCAYTISIALKKS